MVLASTVILAMALRAIDRELAGHTIHDLAGAIRAVPWPSVILSLLCAAGSYASLTLIDWLGLKDAGARIGPVRLGTTSFVAHALGHSAGFSALTGGAVRLRSYASAGVSIAQIARVIVTVSTGFALGSAALAAFALIARPQGVAEGLGLPGGLVRAIGALVGVALVAILLFLPETPRTIRLRGREIALPRRRQAFAVLAASCIDLLCAAAALYVLLPQATRPGPIDFLPIYLVSLFTGVLSTVPGGAGVFEWALLHLSSGMASDQVLAATLVYRVTYYLLPLAIAFVLVTLAGASSRQDHIARGVRVAFRSLEPLVPTTAAAMAFLLGAWLVLTGSLPRSVVPLTSTWLPVAEASHLLASVVGVLLLLLAAAMQRRNRAALLLATIALTVGAALLGLRSLWPQAAVLATGAVLLGASHRAFYRPAALLDEPWSWRWIASVTLVLIAATWLTLFVHKHVEYRNDLWWRFAIDADAPRALRAMLAVTLTLLGFALWRLLTPTHRPLAGPSAAELDRLVPIVAAAQELSANLVMLADKAVLPAASGAGFVMYQRSGGSLIAMGDPIGTRTDRDQLRWSFRELADKQGLNCVFYEVGRTDLEAYLDLGLTLIKLGEEAIVPLADFSLEGKARAGLRQALNRGRREGLEFSIVAREEIEPWLATLEQLSDDWLAARAGTEKGFSLGFFSLPYLERNPIALVRKDGRALAFANLWFAAQGRLASIDLMRHANEAPPGIMDYLFVELLLWAKTQGVERFSLGMAPLSGLATHRLASRWQRLLGFAAARGGRLYNFEGLRHFKAKFGPEWQARYLAAPGGYRLPRVLLDVTRLIARGPG